MTNSETLAMFKSSGALLDGHFRLTSGRHSNSYFQCAKVLQYPEYLSAICGEIAGQPEYVLKLRDLGIDTVSLPPRLIPRLRRAIQAADCSRPKPSKRAPTRARRRKDSPT